MEIRVLDNGLFESNTWLVGQDGVCAVIDCGASTADVLATAADMGCRITHILLTHGHVDHTFGLAALAAQTGARIYAHRQEAPVLADVKASGYSMFGIPRAEPFPIPDEWLDDGDRVPVGSMTFRILHTPGHTAGCACFGVGTHLFTGDTLFCRGVGRTDLPTGDARALVTSLREKLYPLDPAITVHPGHGPDTTIGEEKRENPHVTMR